MTTEDSQGPSGDSSAAAAAASDGMNSQQQNENKPPTDSLSSQRVFKKTSPNGKLTLYLSSRDLVVSAGKIDKLQGVLLIDPEFVENRKVYGQVTLTFRYGREDEEVMGLKFCNEAIMCLTQLYPPVEYNSQINEQITPLQEALVKRLGSNAYPFNMEITHLAPPSVQLVPAKEYHGAPIGTSYDVRAYVADRADEKLNRRTTIRMGIRVVQRAFAPPSPYLYVPGGSGKTCKERAKQNRKILLFGCKSAPLDVQFTNNLIQQQQHNNQEEHINENLSKSAEIVGPTNNEPSSTTHVSFKENILNYCNEYNGDGITTNGEEDEFESPKNEISMIPPHASPEESLDGGSKTQPDDGEQTEDGISENDNKMLEEYLCGGKRPSLAAYLAGVPPPRATIEKPFLLSDGKVTLSASLDKAIYSHGEHIQVNVQIFNNSNKTVRRIKVFVVQHVDVCMFSNGKFKNVVAMINAKPDCPITSGCKLEKTYTLLPLKSSTKNWIALEDSYTKSDTSLASTVTSTSTNPDERNVFAIYVSYYVKIKLLVSVMGGEVCLKLPFTLMHTCNVDYDDTTLTRGCTKKTTTTTTTTTDEIKQEKDGT